MSNKISNEQLIEWRDGIPWLNSQISTLREFAELQVSAINELLEFRTCRENNSFSDAQSPKNEFVIYQRSSRDTFPSVWVDISKERYDKTENEYRRKLFVRGEDEEGENEKS